MSISISISFSDVQNGSGVINVENKDLVTQIFPNFNDTLKVEEFKQLTEIAKISGETDVLETADSDNGVNRLKTSIIKGEASLEKGFLNAIMGGNWKGDIYIKIPKGTTMAEIKKMYSLPDGALANYCRNAGSHGGNQDTFKTIANGAWFSAEDFAKGNNISYEEALKMFEE